MPGGQYPMPAARNNHLTSNSSNNPDRQVALVTRGQSEDSINLSSEQQLARLNLQIAKIEAQRGRGGENQPE